MKRTVRTEEQIIGILREHEAGAKCADLCRRHGMSEGAFCAWKAKYSGLTVSEAKRLKALEDENARLKRLTPVEKREAVAHLQSQLGLSERQACQTTGSDRKMVRYRSRRAPDTARRGRLRELAHERRRFGYRRLFVLRRAGEASGRGRVYRLYREEGLTDRKRQARRRFIGIRAPIACGRQFRVLNVVDDVTRERLTATPDTSISGRRVAPELTALVERRGKPGVIVSDNGTELTSNAILKWSAETKVAWHYIAPGKPHAQRLRRTPARFA